MRYVEHLLGCGRDHIRRIAGQAGSFYRPFDRIEVRHGRTKERHIDNPTGELKELQNKIQRKILATVPIPRQMYGSVRGRSILGNALQHVHQPVVVTMDLKDCFPSIDDLMVFKVFKALGCSVGISSLFTKMTTFQRRLPQGPPTSPTLANLALRPLYEELQALAREASVTITFYLDDITISGEEVTGEFQNRLVTAISRHGFRVGRNKTHIMRRGTRQTTTGVLVSCHASAIPTLRQHIRNEIYELGNLREVPEDRLKKVWGQIQFVDSLDRGQGEALTAMADRYLPLTGQPGQQPPTPTIRECHDVNRHGWRPRQRPSRIPTYHALRSIQICANSPFSS